MADYLSTLLRYLAKQLSKPSMTKALRSDIQDIHARYKIFKERVICETIDASIVYEKVINEVTGQTINKSGISQKSLVDSIEQYQIDNPIDSTILQGKNVTINLGVKVYMFDKFDTDQLWDNLLSLVNLQKKLHNEQNEDESGLADATLKALENNLSTLIIQRQEIMDKSCV